MGARLFGPFTAFVAAATLIDFFVRWAPRHYERREVHEVLRGWNYAVGPVALFLVAVVLWEIVGATGLVTRRSADLARYALALGCGIFVVSSVMFTHWSGAVWSLSWSSLAYGAWTALGLGVILVLVALVQLRALTARHSLDRPWGASRTAAAVVFIVAAVAFVGYYARWSSTFSLSDVKSLSETSPAPAYGAVGWEVSLPGTSLVFVALLVWCLFEIADGLAFAGIPTSLLSIATGSMVIGSGVNLHWFSAPFRVGAPWSKFTALAWIEISLGVLLVAIGAVRLSRARTTRMRDAA